jgi:putative effector of murein hydrolase LrgA (UPF0299 family)|tara:strand:+ start:3290 stop:3643 length:354 start_codon:yes stop_codon:yes gene_type:complete
VILHLALLLTFQLTGAVISRVFALPLPGPVIGMALLLCFLMAAPRVALPLRTTAQGLLSHLSLLFVPAGVGVVGHLDLLGAQGGPIFAVLVISTTAAIAVAALTFTLVARKSGAGDA